MTEHSKYYATYFALPRSPRGFGGLWVTTTKTLLLSCPGAVPSSLLSSRARLLRRLGERLCLAITDTLGNDSFNVHCVFYNSHSLLSPRNYFPDPQLGHWGHSRGLLVARRTPESRLAWFSGNHFAVVILLFFVSRVLRCFPSVLLERSRTISSLTVALSSYLGVPSLAIGSRPTPWMRVHPRCYAVGNYNLLIFAMLTTVDFRITGLPYDVPILLYPRSATAIIVLLEFTALIFGS